MINFLRKIFQIILLIIGIFFLYMMIMMIWGLFQPIPDHEQLVNECNEMFKLGSYSHIPETEKLSACLDDSYKSMGGIIPFAVIFIPISILIAWICLRYGLRIFKK